MSRPKLRRPTLCSGVIAEQRLRQQADGLGRRRAQTADTVPKRSRADCAPSAPPLNVRGALYPTEPLSARGGGASPDRTDRAIKDQRTAHRITSAVEWPPLEFPTLPPDPPPP